MRRVVCRSEQLTWWLCRGGLRTRVETEYVDAACACSTYNSTRVKSVSLGKPCCGRCGHGTSCYCATSSIVGRCWSAGAAQKWLDGTWKGATMVGRDGNAGGRIGGRPSAAPRFPASAKVTAGRRWLEAIEKSLNLAHERHYHRHRPKSLIIIIIIIITIRIRVLRSRTTFAQKRVPTRAAAAGTPCPRVRCKKQNNNNHKTTKTTTGRGGGGGSERTRASAPRRGWFAKRLIIIVRVC